MSQFVALITAFPTAIFTILMGICLLYWLMVILGALDIDILDADGALEGADGAVDGAVEGAIHGIEGAIHGAEGAIHGVEGAIHGVEGAIHGVEGAIHGVEGAVHGVEGAVHGADGAAEGIDADGLDGAHGFGGVLETLRLRNAPLTVIFSMIVFFGWVLSMVFATNVAPHLGALPPWLLNTLLMVVTLALAMTITSFASRPMRKVFRGQQGDKRSTLIGKIVIVDTGSVDEKFGQARFDEAGATNLIQIRTDADRLKRGSEALVLAYDKKREAFIVEPYKDILRGSKSR